MSTDIEVPEIRQVVNLERYPLLEGRDKGGRRVYSAARRELKERGIAELPDFAVGTALKLLNDDAVQLTALARSNAGAGMIYSDGDPGHELFANDPRRLRFRERMHVVAYEDFPATSLIRRLYEWEPMRTFIGRCFGDQALYRYADELGALNLTVLYGGEEKQWHFDQNDRGVTLALQAPQAGGEFEIVPGLRPPIGDADPRELISIIAGQRQKVFSLPTRPGSLLLFNGATSLHRVTPVEGNRSRLVAVLAFDSRPGIRTPELLKSSRYGSRKFKESSG